MSDESADLRKELLRRMAALRQTIDPKVLNRAKLATFGKVPYDQETAKQAVSQFLDQRDDGGAFRRKLEQALKQEGAALDLESGKDTAPKADSHPLKPRRIGRIV
ncbi:hypothetical protein [Azospirillum sp.]|uniref:hypothetical protein n=1 Tax=Azospirillum sp. TaxID=34012 RepID=UPI003D726B34